MPGAPQTKAHFGQAVHLALLNADRFADAIIGAPDASNGAPDGGFYAILRGAAGGLVTRHAKGVGNSTSGDRLGITVAG
jgi:hypothetical protein